MPARDTALHWGKAIDQAGDTLEPKLDNKDRGTVLDQRPDLAKQFAEAIREAGFAIKNQRLVRAGDRRPIEQVLADLRDTARFGHVSDQVAKLFAEPSPLPVGDVRVEEVWFGKNWKLEEDGLPELHRRGLKDLPPRDFQTHFVKYTNIWKPDWKGYVCPVSSGGGVLFASGDTGGRDLFTSDVGFTFDPHCCLLGVRE